MADVAAKAGVSTALVSTVFRGVPGASASTRERVLLAASELGYRLDNRARMLRRSRTRLLGVMFRLQDAFHTDLAQELYPAARDAGYDLVLSGTTPQRPEQAAVESLLDERCEAVILISPQMGQQRLVALSDRLPVTVLARRVAGRRLDLVRTPDDLAVDLAMWHLRTLGHQRIWHLDGGSIHGATDRRRSYLNAMSRHGREELCNIVPAGNAELDGIRAARIALDGADLPTAVVTFNDRAAIGFMFEMRAQGVRVPEDLSVVGFDDIAMSSLPFVSLTTVGQDVPALARAAIQHAVGRLEGRASVGTETLIRPHLKVRQTTGAPAVIEEERASLALGSPPGGR